MKETTFANLISTILILIGLFIVASLVKPETYCAMNIDNEPVQCGIESLGLCEAHHDGLGWCKIEGTNAYISKLNYGDQHEYRY